VIAGGNVLENLKWLLVILALVAALGYLLMGVGVTTVPEKPLNDTSSDNDAPPGFDWIMFGGYLAGGLLILLKKRWLLITGAVLNAIPIIGFYAMWASRTDVMLSAPGLMTKIPQILLEIGLIYWLVKSRAVKTSAAAT
jgi:hypothetical protein